MPVLPSDVSDLITWQENTKFLYSFLNVFNLEWPSLTIQWTQTSTQPTEDGYRVAQYLLGTHANEKRLNYVHMFHVKLPDTDVVSMEKRDFEKHTDYSGFSYGSIVSEKKYKMVLKISSPLGEIHKARCSLPFNGKKLGAAMVSDGTMFAFDASIDVSNDLEVPAVQSTQSPDPETQGLEHVRARLVGHSTSGWGLAWSHFDPTHLVSCSDDRTICTWDVQMTPVEPAGATNVCVNRRRGATGQQQPHRRTPQQWSAIPELKPVRTFSEIGHVAAPQTVIGDKSNPAQFITAGDDGLILIWDSRVPEKERCFFPACKQNSGHSFNNIDQNSIRPHLLASAGSDTDVCLWDTRMCGPPIGRLSAHEKMVNAVHFNDTYEHLLASSSADSRVKIWDLRDIGKEQSPEMAADGPPEFMFSHSGHPASVQDLQWAGNKGDLFITSVCDSNQWHIWRMDKSICYREGVDDSEGDDEATDTFPVE